MDEQTVRNAIQALMERQEVRIAKLEAENKRELLSSKRLQNEVIIGKLQHATATLIELHHKLRLCNCPDEAYQHKEVTSTQNK